MVRLIDADALTIDLFKKAMDDALLTGNADMHRLLIQVVAHYPTVDAVPVIRCRDCKHAEHEDDGDIMCTFWDFCECNHHVLGNGYCDRAERKEE